ncbi:MAG TPA: sulfite exporter TauE/SafE family protein [Sulfurospirillum arcachonense]|nr:sulfite exporter TauE/SafE family protein [Sulfurospirillum arcachonense]
METTSYLTIITIAFTASFGHCIGMCGGIVIAYSSAKIKIKWDKKHQILAHVFYSLGRISTYVFFGALFGFIGSVISFSNLANGILLIITGLAMILVGSSLSGKVKIINVIEHSIQNSSWYHNSFRKLLESEFLGSFYILGLLNGLLPCGLVYFFAMTAASTASVLSGALVMLIFGLSTIPAMFSLGFFIGVFRQTAIRNSLTKLATISILLYGVYIIYDGYEYITNPNITLLESR